MFSLIHNSLITLVITNIYEDMDIGRLLENVEKTLKIKLVLQYL